MSKSGEVPELLATSSCVLGAPCTLSKRNARNIGSLFTCTSVNLVLFEVQRFMFIFDYEFYFKLVLFTIYLWVHRPSPWQIL
jgi:hypothetical protein